MKRFMQILCLTIFLMSGCSQSTAPPQHSILLSPDKAQVYSGASLQFQAQVMPDGSDQSVTWKVGGVGTISSTGLYEAPSRSGNAEVDLLVTVTVTSPTHGVSAVARLTIPSASSLVNQGWTAFASGDLNGAEVLFGAASQTVGSYSPALVGQAWIDFREGRVDDAQETWSGVEGDADALAGLVLLQNRGGNAQQVIDLGKALIQLDSTYVFPGDSEYSATDIRWLVARATLETGDYPETAAQLDVLSPGHSLDPFSASFPEQALLLLESIQESV